MTFSRGFALDTLLDVRRDIERFACEAGLAELRLYYFVVAVNEMMTNAIHHGGGRGRVEVEFDGGCFRARILDDGPGVPDRFIRAEPRPSATTLSGRGLWLTRQLCDQVDIRSAPTGTTVLLEFRADV
jgi:anti-sigma regulatory factor (Ser/Thr protein kinase)